MKLLFSILITFVCITSSIAQKGSYTGMLEYKITIRDTSLRKIIPDQTMIVYSNDTITRKENDTEALGKQVEIHHMELNKSYILLNGPWGKYAIQNDLNNPDKPDTIPSKYSFGKKKWFKTKILGRKAKRIMVSHPNFEEPIEFLYLKKLNNKYLGNFDDAPGLLVKYSVSTVDGIYDYELVKISEYTPNRDLFGIPSDYLKVTIEEFMDVYLGIISPQELYNKKNGIEEEENMEEAPEEIKDSGN